MVVGALFCLQIWLSPYIRQTHTWWMFNQLEQLWESREQESLRNAAALPNWLSAVAGEVDWNTCRLEDGQIFDGWQRPVRVTVSENQLALWSAGADGTWDTVDDVCSSPKEVP